MDREPVDRRCRRRGGAGAFTVTVAHSVREPPAPVAVSMYRVVLEGQTSFDPFASTLPTPSSSEALLTLAVDQLSVEHLPLSMVDGEAEKEMILGAGVAGGGGGAGGAGLAGQSALTMAIACFACSIASLVLHAS